MALAFGTTTLTAMAQARAGQADRPEMAGGRGFVAVATNEVIVNGEVSSRSETGFTVLSRTSELIPLLVTAETTITKAAATIALKDLAVGDKVSATATRGADGKLVAVSVTVRTPTD